GKRAVAIMLDEALSSLRGFAIIFPALKLLEVGALGVFTLTYAIILLAKVLLKALLLDPLSIRFSAGSPAQQRAAGAQAAGACLLAGVALLIVSACMSLLFQDHRATLLAAGVAVPVLIVQEAWRVYFFTAAKVWRAVTNDAMSLVATIVLIWSLTASTEATAVSLLGVWI